MTEKPTGKGTVSSAIAGLVLGCCAILFGGYLAYDRVLLSLRAGQIEERIGVLERHADPGSFWYAMLFYGFVGFGLVAIGLFTLWRIGARHRRDMDDQ